MAHSQRSRKIERALRDDIENARLRLALLKENSRYRKFIKDNRERFIRECALDPFGPEWTEVDPDGNKVDGVSKDHPETMSLYSWFTRRLCDFGIEAPPWRFGLTHKEAIAFLDPEGDIDSLPDATRDRVLARMFYTHGIWQVEADGPGSGPAEWSVRRICTLNERPEATYREWWDARFAGKGPLDGLKGWERLYLVDFRKSKTRLMEEFEAIIESMVEHRKHADAVEHRRYYASWSPDTRRARKEAWRHLEVWRLRRQRKTFSEIATGAGGSEDAAKKSFYRAFELIQGIPYRKEDWEIVQGEREHRTCAACAQRDTCTEPCPEVFDEKMSTDEYIPRDAEVSEILEDRDHSRADLYAFQRWQTREEDE